MQDRVTLPQWLDNLIFEQLGAKYCRSNADMTVIDWDKNNVLNYLGTYFPRSYAESYCIFSDYFKKHPEQFTKKTELSIFDFGCGTGGEIIGLLDAIRNAQNIQKLSIYALDGNYHALRLLEKVINKLIQRYNIEINLRVVPIKIDDFYDLSVLDRIINQELDIIMTFKAICEFVTQDRFERNNAYTHIINTFLPKLKEDGVMVLADVSTYNNVSQEWLPIMMDAAISQIGCCLLCKNDGYNQTFTISHSNKTGDISKIAWRIIKNKTTRL